VSRVLVGVDGGGTGTTALVVAPDGEELGRATGGPALIDPLAPGRAAEAVAVTVRSALDAAGAPSPVVALWAGLAGAGREASRAGAERALGAEGLAERVAVGTDLAAATADAFPAGPGILVIAGTGSVAWGRGADGSERRVGGWGAHLGDEGSGYAIGLAALRRILHASDGRGEETALTAVALGQLELAEPGALVEWGHRATKSQIAALTRAVVEVAEEGDSVARALLDEAVGDLAGHVVGLRDALGPWPSAPTCALTGGLLNARGPLRAPLAAALREAEVVPLDVEVRPERGATVLARQLIG